MKALALFRSFCSRSLQAAPRRLFCSRNLQVALQSALFLLFAIALQAADAFRFAELDSKSLGLYQGDKPVFVYNHGIMKKEGVPADRYRSTYIHPLYGLDGEVLTDDFPKDHYHHRGLFWGWPHVGIAGKEYSTWDLRGIEQRFEKWLDQKADSTGATLAIENGWYVGDRKVVSEKVSIRVHPSSASDRSIDLDFTWTPIGEPLTLRGADDKSYGGLTLRFAPRTRTVITTPKGQGSEDLTVTRLPWADLSARFASREQPSGAAIFIAPDHPDFPPEWLTRHYGVLCVGWPGVTAKTFPPGEPIRCRYRVWIHRGAASVESAAKAFESFGR